MRFPAAEDVLPEDRVLRDAQPIEDNDSDEEQKDPEIPKEPRGCLNYT